MTPTELRVQLRQRGYDPLPIIGKRPPMDGWQKKLDANNGEIDLWPAMWPQAKSTGVLCRWTPFLDIDVLDPDAAQAAEDYIRGRFEEYADIIVRIGKPPKRAIPFRTDAPFDKITVNLIAANGDMTQKLEFLADGQQCVVDGIHPDTAKPYAWFGKNLADISRDELPYINASEAARLIDDVADLLEREHGYQIKGRKRKADPNDPDDDGGRERTDWADRIAGILRGEALHDNTVSLAASYIASGMSTKHALRQLRALMLASVAPHDERFQARLDDLVRIVREAEAKYGGESEQRRGGNKKSASNLQSAQANRVETMPFDPMKQIVPGILIEGLTLLAGKPKGGKSWLLLHVAVAVASNGWTLGELHCMQGDVLYCALEDSYRRLQSRLRKLGLGFPERLHLAIEMPRLVDGGLDQIVGWLDAHPQASLIIIDTLAMVRGERRREQTTYDADYEAVLALRKLANERKIAIVVVHHLRKADADDAFDTVSGTLGLTGAPDSILILRRDGQGGYCLAGRGRDLIEFEKAMTFDRQSCRWRIAGEAAEVKRSGERSAVLTAIEEAGEPIGPNDIAAAAGMRAGNVRRLLLKLVKEGAVEKEGYGRYKLKVLPLWPSVTGQT
jgi:hypothetical protein